MLQCFNLLPTTEMRQFKQPEGEARLRE